MNRIDKVLSSKSNLLSIYFTSGFPKIEDTIPTMKALQSAGVDMLEIGLPFSDPLADGPVIQQSSQVALQNGMSTEKLFQQLENIRDEINIPLIAMGYFNAMFQYGVEKFCQRCASLGIDGIIMPDLPLDVYEKEYKSIFEANGLHFICLITPQTSEERIRKIDEISKGFIYMVSTASTTGKSDGFGEEQTSYFKRIQSMNLKNPCIVGFGIKEKKSFEQACTYAKGGIIGSAFIKHVEKHGVENIDRFIKEIKAS